MESHRNAAFLSPPVPIQGVKGRKGALLTTPTFSTTQVRRASFSAKFQDFRNFHPFSSRTETEDELITDAQISVLSHGALVQALALPALKAAREVASLGFTAIIAFVPERRRPVRLRHVNQNGKGDNGKRKEEDVWTRGIQKAHELGDPDSIFISTTPHRVRLHAKVVRYRPEVLETVFDGEAPLSPESHDVLCLHGAMGSAHCFRDMQKGLSNMFQGSAAAFDRPPFGLSELSPVRTVSKLPFGLVNEAELTTSAIRALRLRSDSLVLVGHSMGGALALRYAIDNPEKPKALILLAPALSVRIPRALRAALRATFAVPPVGRRVIRERCRVMAKNVRHRTSARAHEGYTRPMRRMHWDEGLRNYLKDFSGFFIRHWKEDVL